MAHFLLHNISEFWFLFKFNLVIEMKKPLITSRTRWNKLETEFSRNCDEWGVPIDPTSLSELLHFRNPENDAGISELFQITINPRTHRHKTRLLK